MDNEVKGIKILEDKELRRYVCDTEKPFVFMSYAHSDGDLVRTVYADLCKKGYNVWLDAVKLPHTNRSWNETARTAILNPNCYCLLFFRSENAVGSKPCLHELTAAVHRKSGELPMISVDIWKKKTSMGAYFSEISGDGEVGIDQVNLCGEFADITNKEANAVRLREDCENDVSVFADRIADILKNEYDVSGEEGSSNRTEQKKEPLHSFRLNWEEYKGTCYDYFLGASEQYYTDYADEDEPDVFTGFTCACAIKTFHTQKGENYVVFVNDIDGDYLSEGYFANNQVTAAYMCDDGSTAEDFIREFEADEKNCEYLGYGDGYFFEYMEKKMKNRFKRCAEKWENEDAKLCDDRNMFLKYLFSDREKKEIEETLNRMAEYEIRYDPEGCRIHYRV